MANEYITKPYADSYYLLYGKNAVPETLDIDGTLSFLQSLGYSGGELKAARESYATIAAMTEEGLQEKEGVRYCSYCGCEISGADYYTLPDGRNRCTVCSASLVESLEEFETIFKNIKHNMELFFGAILDVDIHVQLMDERKLKKHLNISLDKGSDSICVILGVAIKEKDSYSICIENDAPRISLISTVAHEMTHIWQYTNWNENTLKEKYGKNLMLELYEGMAEWVQIQYLYLIGETAAARRSEFRAENRDDEYGHGFLKFRDRYPLSKNTMVCHETPFTNPSDPL